MSEKTVKAEKKEKDALSIEDQLKIHKHKHGEVLVLRVEGKVAFIKKEVPTSIYAKAMGHMTPVPGVKNDPNPYLAGNTILLGCWIDGDAELKTDAAYTKPASMACLQLIATKTASLEGN